MKACLHIYIYTKVGKVKSGIFNWFYGVFFFLISNYIKINTCTAMAELNINCKVLS